MPPKIHTAAAKGDVRAVHAALQAGEKVDSRDIANHTALHWAARKGRDKVLAVLIAANASLDLKTRHGKTAIELAREHDEAAAIDFLEHVHNMQAGKTPRKPSASSSPNKSKSTPGKSGSSPIRQRRAPTADDIAEGKKAMLAWSKGLSDQYLREVEEADKHARIEAERAAEAMSKEQKQAEEIQRMRHLLKQVKEMGGDASAVDASGSPTRSAQILSLAEAAIKKSPQNHKSPGSIGASPMTLSPPSKDFTSVRRDSERRRQDEAAKRKANAARVRERSAKRAQIAAERKQAEEAEKRAAVEKQREATRLANERSKRAREKAHAKAAASAAADPIVAVNVSVDKEAKTSTPRTRALKKTPRSTRKALTPSSTKSTPLKGASGGTRTPPGSVTSISRRDQSSATRKGKSIPNSANRHNLSSSSNRPSRPTTSNPSSASRRAASPLKSQIPVPTTESEKGESVEMGSLEAEYIQMMRGITSKPGFKDQKKQKSPAASSERAVVSGAYAIAGAAANPQEATEVFTIVKILGQGLGVGIFSSKSATGIRVKNIVAGSPFQKAGVKEGYRFISIAGKEATTHDSVVSMLKSSPDTFEVVMGIPIIAPPTPAQEREKAEIVIQRSLKAFLDAIKSRSVTIHRSTSTSPLGVALFSRPEDKVVQVDRLVPGGPFVLAGIKEKDAILQVNGASVVGQSHTEVIHLLKASDATMILDVASMQEVNDNIDKLANVQNVPNSSSLAPSPLGVSDHKNSTQVTYSVTRQPNAKLGVALMTLKDSSGITLHSITPDGPFGVARVPEGYQILQVDGVDMASHADVVDALSKAKETFTVTVAPPIVSSPRQSVSPGGDESGVELAANLSMLRHEVTRIPRRGLGLALYSNKRKVGVRISQVNPGGPIALAGIKRNEVIVQIDGVSLLKASHDEVCEALKNAPQKFVMVTVHADELDKATGTLSETSSTSTDKSTANEESRNTALDDEMRYDPAQTNRKSLFGAVRTSVYGDEDEQDDMRSYSSLKGPLEDDRLASFSGLSNSEGFRAAKQAQAQANSLFKATQDYVLQFEEPTAAPKNGADGEMTLPASAETGSHDPSVRGSPPKPIDTILSTWHQEFSPKRNHHSPMAKRVKGRRTAVI